MVALRGAGIPAPAEESPSGVVRQYAALAPQ
jgi:hypothetical protein